MRATLPSALFILSLTAACGPRAPAPSPAPPPTRPAPAPEEKKTTMTTLEEPPIWMTVAEVTTACDEHLKLAEAFRQQLLGVKDRRTAENTLHPMNALLIALDRVMPTAELVANTHPDKAVRTAAEECSKKAKKVYSDLLLDRPVFDALSAVDAASLEGPAARFLKNLLRDYRRNGVDKDEATRKKLAELQERMTELGQTFSRNIRESRKTMKVSEKDLAGLPADFIAARRKAAEETIDKALFLSTDTTDFLPVLTYAKSDRLRRDLYVLSMTRAYPENEPVLADLLKARYAYARLLGYPDWAEYAAEDKMVRSKKTIAEFIDKVTALSRPRMKADLAAVLKRKRRDLPKAKDVGSHDRFYYVNRIKAEQFGVDTEEVRAYFDFKQVKEGLLSLAQELFGLTFKRVPEAKVWHPTVEAYDMFEGGVRIARFYLDLHPREGKYSHAAEFPILTGIPGVQLPSAALVTNFPDPSKSDGPALTEHTQVTTFFHEFGHLMHQLLSGRHPYVTQSGITCEWDFVEAPSQLFEEWTWDPAVLARFARHHKTGEAIPEALVKKMIKAREVGKGLHIMRQMFFAALSFQAHNQDPETFKPLELVKTVQQAYGPYPYQEGTFMHASFGHLEGYSSMYYTYMWSLVLAKDIFTRFQERGLMDQKTAVEYRKAVLEAGGSVDAEEMVKTFLGRPYAFAAFETYLKE